MRAILSHPHVAKLIEKYGFHVQTGVRFSEQDINEAEWLAADVGAFQYPQPEDTYIEATYRRFRLLSSVQNGRCADRNAFRLKSRLKTEEVPVSRPLLGL